MGKMKAAIAVGVLLALGVGQLPAQQSSQVQQLLLKYRNWRYGMISAFKVSETDGTIEKLNQLLGPKEPEMSEEARQCKQKEDVENYVISGGEGMDEKEVQKIMRAPGCKAYERYYSQKLAWERAQFKKAFVVTTRYTPNEPFKVIGLLVQKNTESYYTMRQDLDPPSDIFLASQMKVPAPEGSPAATLVEFLENQIIQGNMENVTTEAQGIGEEGIRFVRQSYGNTELISDDDQQMYMRITEGMPKEYQAENEVIASLANGISYRRYERPPAGDDAEIDSTMGTNRYLPKYGVELKFGLEDLNYPGLWSNRAAINALWGSSKLGLILPSGLWSNVSNDLGSQLTMTNAGIGVNGQFDFPIKVVSQSGVFRLTAGYVFSDAKKSDHMRLDTASNRYEDYLVRFNGSLQYSFAVKIDKDFMFRMRLGGTLYNMETWIEKDTVIDGELDKAFVKDGSQTIGGLSGAVDFMTTSWSTPVGASLSYFDETLLTSAWLQIPIADPFAVRLSARIFTPVFRDPRPWELESVVMPAVDLIFNF